MKIPPATTIARIALATVVLLSLHLALGAAQTTPYENCSTNFTVLEQAYRNTEQNLFRTWETFYPPRDPIPLYVKVTYTFQTESGTAGNEQDVEDEHYIWTAASIYLMQSPAVYSLTSLFLGFAGEDRIQELTLFLPYECRGLKNITEDSESNYLEVLTHRLKLYAQSRGGQLHITDEYFAKAIRNPSHDLDEEYRLRNPFINVFVSTLVGLPIVFMVFILWFVKGARWQIRKRLLHAQPAVYASLASVIITGLFFSLYVLGIDVAAVVCALRDNKFSPNEARFDYTRTPLLLVTFATLGLDGAFFLIGFLMLIMATFKKCSPLLFKCCCSSVFCCTKFGQDYEDDPEADKERRLWLLSGALVAPIGCIGSHFGYIILAWLSFPVGAGGVFLTYAIVYVINYFIFRQLYLTLIDRAYNCCCSYCLGEDKELGSPMEDKSDSKAYVESNGFNYRMLWVEIAVGIFIAAVEVWILIALVYLPINDLAEYAGYLHTFTTTVLVVVGGLISYKLLTPHPKTTSHSHAPDAFHEKAYETYSYLHRIQATQNAQAVPPEYNSREEKMGALWAMFLYRNQHSVSDIEQNNIYGSVFPNNPAISSDHVRLSTRQPVARTCSAPATNFRPPTCSNPPAVERTYSTPNRLPESPPPAERARNTTMRLDSRQTTSTYLSEN